MAISCRARHRLAADHAWPHLLASALPPRSSVGQLGPDSQPASPRLPSRLPGPGEPCSPSQIQGHCLVFPRELCRVCLPWEKCPPHRRFHLYLPTHGAEGMTPIRQELSTRSRPRVHRWSGCSLVARAMFKCSSRHLWSMENVHAVRKEAGCQLSVQRGPSHTKAHGNGFGRKRAPAMLQRWQNSGCLFQLMTSFQIFPSIAHISLIIKDMQGRPWRSGG